MLLTIDQLGVTIQAAVVMASEVTVVLEDVKHGGKAREDEYLVLVLARSLHQLVKENHLAGRVNQVLAKLRQSIGLLAIEEVRVVADLAQLDQDVLVVGDRGAFLDALLLQ